MSLVIRNRWVEVESAFEDLADLDPEARLTHLAAIALVDVELANAVGELLRADEIERSALDLDAALLVAAVGDDPVGEGPQADGAAPRTIGPCRILRRVGSGSAGEVFEADLEGRRVAVKRLLPGFAGSEIERRFALEREILAGLDHPAIARLLDAGTDRDGRAFLVLEWIEGLDIVAFAQQKALPEVERLRLFLRLCEAVATAHRHRVLHRDLKPANVLVTEEGLPKLLDFGIAKLLDAEGTGRETASGVWLFTLDYAAPEQILGRRPGPAADQFSLAVILYELLAGERPLRRGGRPISRVLREVDRERAPRLPWGDRGLRAIVARALDSDPAARYDSVAAFADELAIWLAEYASPTA